MFGSLFGAKPKDPQELVREWKQKLRQEDRKLDRQINSIQREEKKVLVEMKKEAKRGNNSTVKILAKEVVASRHAVKRIYTSKAQLNSVSLELQMQLSQLKMAKAMKLSTDTMGHMNRLMRVGEIQQTMVEMQKEMMKAGMIQEAMDDAIDTALDDEDMEGEVDAEVDKVVDEIMLSALGTAQAGAAKMPAQAQAQAEPEDDIAARLDALRGDAS
eukprot:Hpha_TRINITY_DN15143_c2_g10::TRINITY_DN15143_c2_g10_i1::g.127533::m.127533/K12193/VPS24, CHMP3; charged multivesicular body protein 3